MKYIYSVKALFVTALLISSCVDDYTVSNPPQPFDAPSLKVSASGDEDVTIVAGPLNKFTAYVIYGDPVEITVSVVSARGKIDAVDISSSIEEFGTVELNEASVAALKGQTSGSFKFVFTPSSELPDVIDRSLNVEIVVSDSQVDKNGKPSPQTSTLILPVTLVNGPCFSEGITPGRYLVTEASGNKDNVAPSSTGAIYTIDSLKKYSPAAFPAGRIAVNITETRPGVYTFSEATGGVWPIFYGARAKPDLKINLCGNVISGRAGSLTAVSPTAAPRTFTLDGTLNDDGSISMTWSYVRDDGNTPSDPAKGSYKLVRENPQ